MMLLALILIGTGAAMAQTQASGTVTDQQGEPMIGVTVHVKGNTTTGTITDIDGKFALSVPKGSTLVISYVGYKTQELPATAGMKVVLTDDTEQLDEVFVVAYGTSKRSAFTGSATVINSDALTKKQATNVVQALAGQVAGLQMTSGSGQAGGDAPTMLLRGIGSINASTGPLIIVDGAPYDGGWDNINPADVESISVLKDAASTALYGARGANGVIIITTKNAKSGEAVITASAKWGANTRGAIDYDYIKDPGQYYEAQYRALYNKLHYVDKLSADDAYVQANQDLVSGVKEKGGLAYNVYNYPDGQYLIGKDGKLNPNATLGRVVNGHMLLPDDWTKEAYSTSLRQEYNVNVTGGNEALQLYSSFGYLKDNGVLPNSGYERYSARVKASHQAKKWLKYGMNVGYVYSTTQTLSESESTDPTAFTQGIAPIYPVYLRDANGNIRLKSDPYAFAAQMRPETASKVVRLPEKQPYNPERIAANGIDAPISIYEVHLGSWRRNPENNYWLDYEQLGDELISYVKEMGFTHIELLPLSEFPFDGSWGYQPLGLYAPTSRFGTPQELCGFIEKAHDAGLHVLLDWVVGHFPTDEYGLIRFDGTPLYEHADPREGYHQDWNTLIYNFGRHEVRNFLTANALYWIEHYGVDGLRVDAVASMIYRDYSRKEGEWVPNQYGGRENLEAINFLQRTNAILQNEQRGVASIAEESTAFTGVSHPTESGGLGFQYKWNMGWMNDTLRYLAEDPVNRRYHHGELTFSLVYAFSEQFILPLSHDEVVHGKGSLWNRMPGDAWNKAAGLRSLFAYMWAHPGKNLLFQGQEFGQIEEWSEARSIDWYDMEGWEGEYHRGINALVRTLNSLYKELPALYSQDHTYEGFSWAKSDDASHNVLAFHRHGTDGSKLLCVFNFGGASHLGYTLGVPEGGQWVRILNTDDGIYEGADNDLPTEVEAVSFPWDGYDFSVQLHVPAMSGQWYRWEPEK